VTDTSIEQSPVAGERGRLDLWISRVKFPFSDSGTGQRFKGGPKRMESDVRFFRRRANEELAAAGRAITPAARERRLILADAFLQRLKAVEASSEPQMAFVADRPAFDWRRSA